MSTRWIFNSRTTADKRWPDQQSANPYGKIVMVKMKRQQLFSRSVDTLLYALATGTIVFPQKSPDCKKSIINYDLDITNFLVVSPQIRYIKVFDITNPPFNVPVNSKTAHPPPGQSPGIWLALSSVQRGIWPKMRPARWGIWLSCLNVCQRSEAKGFRNSLIQHVSRVHWSSLLSIPCEFFCCCRFI